MFSMRSSMLFCAAISPPRLRVSIQLARICSGLRPATLLPVCRMRRLHSSSFIRGRKSRRDLRNGSRWAASANADAGERDSNEGPGAALVSAAPRQAPTNPRRRISGTQQLVAHIFQNVGGAFDANFARENRILVLDAEDAFEANVHIGLDDGLPKAGAVTIADGAEGFRGQIEFVGFKGKIEDAELIEVLWKEDCVFHVGVENSALLAKEV